MMGAKSRPTTWCCYKKLTREYAWKNDIRHVIVWNDCQGMSVEDISTALHLCDIGMVDKWCPITEPEESCR